MADTVDEVVELMQKLPDNSMGKQVVDTTRIVFSLKNMFPPIAAHNAADEIARLIGYFEDLYKIPRALATLLVAESALGFLTASILDSVEVKANELN